MAGEMFRTFVGVMAMYSGLYLLSKSKPWLAHVLYVAFGFYLLVLWGVL